MKKNTVTGQFDHGAPLHPGPRLPTAGLSGGAVAALALFLVASPAQADVYRCVMPEGNIVYQEKPCAENTRQNVLEMRKGDGRWQRVMKWEWGVIYYDPSRHAQAGNHVMVWLLYDRTDPVSVAFLKEPYKSVVINETYDCAKRNRVVNSYTIYEGALGKGKVVRKETAEGGGSLDVQLDNVAAAEVFNMFCRGLREPRRRRYPYEEEY